MKHSWILAVVLMGCHDYSLFAIEFESDLDFAEQPEALPDVEDTEDAEGVWDDVVHGEIEVDDDDDETVVVTEDPEDEYDDDLPDIEDGDDNEDPGGGDDSDGEVEEPELSECVPGYQGAYFNLPALHPEVILPAPGLRPGDAPTNHDWFSANYYAFGQVDASLMIGDSWWPVDGGLLDDPAHFAVHWRGWFELPEAQAVTFFFGSDDDGWVLIDGEMVADQGGIHEMDERCYSATLDAGVHRIDIYTADREASASAMWMEWEEPVDVMACDDL